MNPNGFPSCNYPSFYGGILQNGNKHEDMENDYMNSATYTMYWQRLMDIALSVFEWKNLPKGIDSRMIELWLMMYGFVGFFYDDDLKYGSNKESAPEGYAVLPIMLQGNFDLYNYPKERRAYAVNGTNVTLDQTDSVIIFNNQVRLPMTYILELFASRLANIERTIDVNVMNQKCPKVIRCTDRQRLTFKNIMMQVMGNVYYMLCDKNVDLKNIDVLDVTNPFVSLDLQVLKHQIWNEALTYLGIENVNTEKKERLVSDEVLSNMGDVEAQRFTRLVARQKACDEINEKFGLNVDVEFRSGTYIKGNGVNSQTIKVGTMKADGVEGGSYE